MRNTLPDDDAETDVDTIQEPAHPMSYNSKSLVSPLLLEKIYV